MASCDGLICYRSRRTRHVEVLDKVVWNPMTQERKDDALLKWSALIQRPKHEPNSYSFVIYSSETGKWKTSLEVCYCKDELHENKHIYINGRFYWLTSNQNIITFEVDEELSGVITVPGSKWLDGDPCKPIWVLKHHINIDQFGEASRDQYIHRVRHFPEMNGDSIVVDAQTFYDEVVYLSIRGRLCSYDFKTGRLKILL
uniref:F-box protein At3g26010-like beta-propeller domain-containing protein n=1 Tax=Quercus lobata TaxID=97700 RepID=A0A7N2LEN1_QUELO